MDAFFFRESLFRGGIKTLQEFAETDDVDEFMGGDVEYQREKVHPGGLAQGGQNGMVLKADFIVVIG